MVWSEHDGCKLEVEEHVGINPVLHNALPLEQNGSGMFPELDEAQVAGTQLSPSIESQHSGGSPNGKQIANGFSSGQEMLRPS